MSNRYDFGRCPKREHQIEWFRKLVEPEVFKQLTEFEKKFVKDIGLKLCFPQVKLNEEQIWKLEQIYAERTT